MRRMRALSCCGGAALMLLALVSGAAQNGVPEITAEPVPGQLDVFQGTAIKLGSAPPSEGHTPESYRWEIAQGEGGTLYNEDQAEAIFQAPEIATDLELFVIRLSVGYTGQPPAHATVHIRVHREMSQTQPKAREMSIEEVMTNFYREEREARDRNRERVQRNQPRVVHHHTYSGLYGPGWGWGYGWGWPTHYPVYVPIVVPPPGTEWGPGDGDWGEPIAIPYDDVVTTFPEHIADDYLPQDFPGADPVPEMGSAGASPADFIEIPAGVGGEFDDPGTNLAVDFAEPMIDPGFGVDDFGW